MNLRTVVDGASTDILSVVNLPVLWICALGVFAVVGSAGIAALIALDGESNYLEGLTLIGVPFASGLAILSALVVFVPYVGPTTAFALPLLDTLSALAQQRAEAADVVEAAAGWLRQRP